MTSKDEPQPQPCPRCGQIDCDKVDPAALEKLKELLRRLPKDETPEDEDLEPMF